MRQQSFHEFSGEQIYSYKNEDRFIFRLSVNNRSCDLMNSLGRGPRFEISFMLTALPSLMQLPIYGNKYLLGKPSKFYGIQQI